MLIFETQFRIYKLTIISDREFEEFDECWNHMIRKCFLNMKTFDCSLS